MIGQSRAEVLKIRSTRTTLGLALGMVAIILLFVLLTGLLELGLEPDRRGGPAQPVQHRQLRGLFAALAGVLLVTGEYRFGTIRPTFLFTPRRSRVSCAKVAASLVAGFVFAVVGEALALGVGAVILNGRGISIALHGDDYELLTLGTLVGTALWGGIGSASGMIVRNQVGRDHRPPGVGVRDREPALRARSIGRAG